MSTGTQPKPTQEEIAQAIQAFLMQNRPKDVASIGLDDDLFQKGIMDSLQIVGTVAFIESKFQCSLDFEDLTETNLKSVNAMVQLLSRKIGSK